MRRRHGQRWLRQVSELISGLGRMISLPFRALFQATALGWRRLMRARRSLGRVSWFRLAVTYLRLPFWEAFRLIRGIGSLVLYWWPHASFTHLFQGLPALIVALAVLIPLLGPNSSAAFRVARSTGDDGRSAWNPVRLISNIAPALDSLLDLSIPNKDVAKYESAAVAARENEDFEAADIYYRALIQLDPENPYFRFGLAISTDGLANHENNLASAERSLALEDHDAAHEVKARSYDANAMAQRQKARAIMESLAPRDKQGFGPAHFWMGLFLVNNAQFGDDSDELAKAHFLRSLQAKSNVVESNMLVGGIYYRRQQYKEAEQHYSAAVGERPEVWLSLAHIHALQGNKDQAVRDAEKAIEYYQRQVDKDLDNTRARQLTAEALMFLERFDEAARTLEKGVTLTTDPRYRNQLGRVYFWWAENVRRRPEGKASDQQFLLTTSFAYDPGNVMLLRRLISGTKGDEAEATMMRGILRALLARGQALSIVDLLLAVDAEARGQSSAANRYLVKGREIEPRLPTQVAELARSFVVFPPFHEKDAMDLLAVGLRVWPRDSDLLSCRGYLRARNGQYMEALVDLESALTQKPNDRQLHFTLSQVYRNLGNPEKAQYHTQRANGAPASAANIKS
jgi:tetratricopeptide (TPR) repeat protein